METSYKKNVNSFYCNYILIVSRINRSHQSQTLTFQKKTVICFIQSSLKMTKNAFYFVLKTLFGLMIFKFLSSLFGHIVHKKTDKWYIEWWVTINDNEWQPMAQWVTTSGTASDNEWYNEWQRMTTSTTSVNEWRVTTSGTASDKMTASNTTSDNEWQQMAMSDNAWQQWYNEWTRHSTLQRMDDCRAVIFNDKNIYTTTSRDGWLQLEWLNK